MSTNRQALTAYLNRRLEEAGLPVIRRGRPAKPKQCPLCGTKDLTAFGKNRAKKDGFQVYCFGCHKAKRRVVKKEKQLSTYMVEQYISHRLSEE